jgi:hypothetical protein
VNVLELLRNLGDRLGIVEVGTSQPGQAPPKIHMRAVTLAELMTEIRHEQIRTLADVPAELSVPFEKVFAAAGIHSPVHGWTVERLHRLVQSDSLRNLGAEEKRQKVLETLRAGNVDAESIVKEAIAQDRALDEYEALVRARMEKKRALDQDRIDDCDARIRALQAQRAALEAESNSARAQWNDWLRRKHTFEKDLADTVCHLVDRSVISVGKPGDGGGEPVPG